VSRRPSKYFDGKDVGPQLNPDGEEEEEEAAIPQGAARESDAILPGVLRELVQKRKQVKELIKKEKDASKLQQLDIR